MVVALAGAALLESKIESAFARSEPVPALTREEVRTAIADGESGRFNPREYAWKDGGIGPSLTVYFSTPWSRIAAAALATKEKHLHYDERSADLFDRDVVLRIPSYRPADGKAPIGIVHVWANVRGLARVPERVERAMKTWKTGSSQETPAQEVTAIYFGTSILGEADDFLVSLSDGRGVRVPAAAFRTLK